MQNVTRWPFLDSMDRLHNIYFWRGFQRSSAKVLPMNSYMMLHDAAVQTETVGLHFLCDSVEHITEVLREVLHCFGFCC